MRRGQTEEEEEEEEREKKDVAEDEEEIIEVCRAAEEGRNERTMELEGRRNCLGVCHVFVFLSSA